MVWTVVPAAILVFLAVYQMGLWGEIKAAEAPDNAGAVKVQIFAKRFEWNFRYPGADGAFGTPDDPVTSGVLVVPVNRPVNATLRSMDVIHSFFLPNLRFKQDAVPGLTSHIWFRPNKKSADRAPVRDRNGEARKLPYFDVVCAEICGNAHTTMAARMYVVSDEDYEKFLRGEPTSLGDELGKPMTVDLATPTSVYDRIWGQWAQQDDVRPTGPPKWKRFPFGEDDRGLSEEEE
jgi:cytochrome c oxidase subunit 2